MLPVDSFCFPIDMSKLWSQLPTSVWLTVCEASDAMKCHQLQGFLIENLKSGDGNPKASRTPSSLKTGNQHGPQLLFQTLTAPLSQYLSDFKLLQNETWLMTLLCGIPRKSLFVPMMLASKDGTQERWPRYRSQGCNLSILVCWCLCLKHLCRTGSTSQYLAGRGQKTGQSYQWGASSFTQSYTAFFDYWFCICYLLSFSPMNIIKVPSTFTIDTSVCFYIWFVPWCFPT